MKGPKVCNGQETVDGYDQEGLVPFVGKWIIWIKYLPLVFSYLWIISKFSDE